MGRGGTRHTAGTDRSPATIGDAGRANPESGLPAAISKSALAPDSGAGNLLTCPPRMLTRLAPFVWVILFVSVFPYGVVRLTATAVPNVPLPFGAPSSPLKPSADRSADMVRGLHSALDELTREVAAERESRWSRDWADAAAHRRSVEPQRTQLRQLLGAIDPLPSVPEVQLLASPEVPSLLATSAAGEVHAVRWTTFDGVSGEGLWLTPKPHPARARVVLIPDADQRPESLAGLDGTLEPEAQVGRRLLAAGCEVLIVTLLSRESTQSGVEGIAFTDQSHREWAWRPLFEAGRSLVGVEVRKVEAALAWLRSRSPEGAAIGVAGYGEGGLVALHTAALHPDLAAVWVGGYFQARDALWTEPIERNLHGFLRTFGDAELATLALPARVIIDPAL